MVDFLVDSAGLIYTTLWLIAFCSLMAIVLAVVLICNGVDYD
jgi:hypothetical protein